MTTSESQHNGRFPESVAAISMDKLPLGSRCRIIAIDENSENLLRLMEMGLTPGAEVVIEREGPFQSPLSLRLPGCTLAARREDAARILVQPLSGKDNGEKSGL